MIRSFGSNIPSVADSAFISEAAYIVGNLCIISAGCLVSQGMKVPDKSFVAGVPAEIKGEASPQHLYRWAEAAPQAYAELAKQYKDQGL